MTEQKKLLSTVYKSIKVGSPYTSWKTTVPKALVQSKGLTDNFKLHWLQYGDDFLVKVVRE